MAKNLMTTSEMKGVRVLGGKKGVRRIGKVRSFVFHPKEKRIVGFIVKRPDLLWMFHRKDKFVSIDGYDLVDGRIVIRHASDATDRGACKALGIDWDSCVLWEGLPVMAENGQVLGAVGPVAFDRRSGRVESIETDAGATANALLGKRVIPADLIKGFRCGIGAELRSSGHEGWEDEEAVRGAVLVSDEALAVAAEGGVAEQAGKATAIALDKAQTAVDKAKPVVSAAAKKTGEVVNKGAYATGRQIAKTKGMFSGFKEEYDKARGPKPQKKAARETPKALSEGSAPAKKSAAKKSAPSKAPASTKKASSGKTGKNMFAAFKEEYDKARRS